MLLYVVNWQDTQRSHPDVPANYLNLLIHKIKKNKKNIWARNATEPSSCYCII
jgi:hypothetical protein